MKSITLSMKEYMVLRELANKYKYKYESTYNKKDATVTVNIPEEFLIPFFYFS